MSRAKSSVWPLNDDMNIQKIGKRIDREREEQHDVGRDRSVELAVVQLRRRGRLRDHGVRTSDTLRSNVRSSIGKRLVKRAHEEERVSTPIAEA